jgi:hypothetical protein
MNSVAINMGVLVSLFYPKSGNIRSYGSSNFDVFEETPY